MMCTGWLSLDHGLTILSFIGELLVIEEFCFYGNLRDYLVANRDSFINELSVESSLSSEGPRELPDEPITSSSTERSVEPITVSNTDSVLFRKSSQGISVLFLLVLA